MFHNWKLTARECLIFLFEINFFYSGIAAGSLRFATSLNALENEDDFQGSKQVSAKRKFKIKRLVKLPGERLRFKVKESSYIFFI